MSTDIDATTMLYSARDLFQHLFEDLRGNLCIAWLDRSSLAFRQKFFTYPRSLNTALKFVDEMDRLGYDLYFCAHLLSSRQRKKQYASPVQALWADGDGAQIPAGFPAPTAVVRSSNDRHHYYWRLDGPVEPEVAQEMNRRIASEIGADLSGWDLTQLLRVPGTRNHKYDDAPLVKLECVSDGTVELEELEASAPELPGKVRPRIGVRALTPKGKALSTEPPVKLKGVDLKRWQGREPLLPGEKQDRSTRLGRIAAMLVRCGATFEQVRDSLEERDISLGFRKYTGREDASERYDEMAEWAVTNVKLGPAQLLTVDGHTSGFALTDLGNAERLALLYGASLRFEIGARWLVWDETRWARDDDGALRLASLSARAIRNEAAAAPPDSRNLIWHHAERSESNQRIKASLALAQALPGMGIHPNELDARDDELNLRNGTLHLPTGELRPHDPAAFHTKLAGPMLDYAAECPGWLAFLNETFNGDAEMLDYCQRIFGYCLSGSIEEQVFFLLHGNGANGKSTLVRVLLALAGDYGTQLPSETLLKQSNRQQTSDLARLIGVRVAVANEFTKGRHLDEALVKQLTGGERMTARFLYREFTEFEPKCKLLVTTNFLPDLNGSDYAIWRRVQLVPFEYTVPELQRDSKLFDKLNRELPGIFRWAAEGYAEWRSIGLNPPQKVRDAIAAFRSQMDSVGGFINARCDIGPKLRCDNTEIYDAYDFWCDQVGQEALTKSQFLDDVKNRFAATRTRSARGFRGLSVRAMSERDKAA
ncbi:MAG: phage/plasmid primase, P4 family [Dehalococcoidia bacterium]